MSVASRSSRPGSAGLLTESEFDLPALGAALWRNKRMIFGATVLVALIAIAVVQLIPPKYQSESRVLIEERGNIFLRPEADKGFVDRGTEDQEAVASQVQLVLSLDLAREVIDKLKLNKRREFDPLLGGISPLTAVLGTLGVIRNPLRMTPEERVLASYYDRLTVYAVEKSRVIVIDFLSEDPALAARVADAVAEAYLARQQAAKREQARAAGQWLAGEIKSMQKRVAAAEARVAAFRGKSNLLLGPNNTTLAEQQLGDINAELIAARAQEANAEAKAKLIRDMLRSGEPLEYSDVLNSGLIRRLSEQRVTLKAQLAEQSSSLLDRHPRIKELKAQIADLDAQIRAEARTVARSLENDAKLAKVRVGTLAASLEQAKSLAAGTNEQNVELRALERDAKAQRELLESYLARYREASARENSNSEPADARVFSRATVSNIPAYPKKLPTVLIAGLTTMMLCAGWVMTRELLAAPVTIAEVPAAPATRAVAMSAGAANAGERARSFANAVPVATVPLSAIGDLAYSLRRAGEAGRRIAVLAAAPGLETADTAIKLARALAKDSARVVLVGLGPSDDAIKAIASDPSAAGLVELTRGTASFGDIITRDKFSGVNLIAAGRAGAHRIEILSAPRTSTSFAALARSYDHVVVDAGPVGGPELEAIGEVAPHAVLLAETLTQSAATAARDRLLAAGFADATILVGARAASSAPKAAAA